ncbi:dihydrofolate reductase [Ascosphaera pollenicola]|nr:dihydrofolate reductase [Ascosphaera pollenicola]
MSFRKRNIGLSSSTARGIPITNSPSSPVQHQQQQQAVPQPRYGLRPSPIDGRITTSTGTLILDNLLAGHAGLALGSSLLVEENGATDFAGALLRYYAAEGVVQEHKVHVIGVDAGWGRMLPGVIGNAEEHEKGEKKSGKKEADKMKIAWRYERLGEFGAGVAGSRVPMAVESPADAASSDPRIFCHAFDLTKRPTHPSLSNISYYQVSPTDSNPFASTIQKLTAAIASSSPYTTHRIVVPGLLSPALYPPHAANPSHLLQFLHSLRALLACHPDKTTAMLSLPLSLFPRPTALIRWAEILSSGVLELVPFPHSTDANHASATAASGAATANEEPPQGMLKIHKLPVYHERAGGGSEKSMLEDWAFTLSRRRFLIKPFNLPPVEGDFEAQAGSTGPVEEDAGDEQRKKKKKPTAKDLEF